MKLTLILVAVLAIATTVTAKDETDAQRQLRIIAASVNFWTDFYNELVAAPVNVLTSSLASMLVQVTAGIALEGLNGVGKRDVEVLNARILQWASQLGQQIAEALYPILNEQVMAGALTITQILGRGFYYHTHLSYELN